MPEVLEQSSFITEIKRGNGVLIDVRSPSEFMHAHIPHAHNIPLLDDEQRHQIGIVYKQKSRKEAVQKGFELAGPHFASKIQEAKGLCPGGEVLLYCWRGGMRSGIMAWLLETSGFHVKKLKGGYKSFRSEVLNNFRNPRELLILGGKTGSGKTNLLKILKDKGESVLDLEELANHKGSAFGALGREAQVSNEQFENRIFMELINLPDSGRLWIENESRSIGSNKIPDAIYDQMRKAPVLEIDIPYTQRRDRILSEYGDFSKQELRDCSMKLKKRLGGLRLKQCIEALEGGRMNEWLDILLEYYDENYSYGMSQRDESKCILVTKDENESFDKLASRLIEIKNNITQPIS